jgi:hypothetical protein
MDGKHNKKVESFLKMIASEDVFYPNENDIEFLKRYDACDDFHLTDGVIEDVWGFLKKQFNGLNSVTKTVTPITMLHTNAGAGRLLEACPSTNVFINALNNDYTCKTICDLLSKRESLDFSYKSSISNISHFFINGDNGNNPKYDVVFTQPIDTNYYKTIDGTNLTKYDALEYYSLRSLDFLTKGGYLCVFTHPNKFSVLKGNKELFGKAKFNAQYYNSSSMDEYGCIIFKKD